MGEATRSIVVVDTQERLAALGPVEAAAARDAVRTARRRCARPDHPHRAPRLRGQWHVVVADARARAARDPRLERSAARRPRRRRACVPGVGDHGRAQGRGHAAAQVRAQGVRQPDRAAGADGLLGRPRAGHREGRPRDPHRPDPVGRGPRAVGARRPAADDPAGGRRHPAVPRRAGRHRPLGPGQSAASRAAARVAADRHDRRHLGGVCGRRQPRGRRRRRPRRSRPSYHADAGLRERRAGARVPRPQPGV